MNADNISKLLTTIGCRSLRVTGTKVLATCPFEHEHSSGRDNSPSFVVFVADRSISTWNCSYPHITDSYSSGNLDMLVKAYACARGLPTASAKWGDWDDEGPSLHGLYKFVWTHECSSHKVSPELKRLEDAGWSPIRKLPSIEGRYVPAAKMPKLEVPALPKGYMDRYSDLPSEALEYLRGEERGLDDYTIDFWGLKYDSHTHRVIIPIYDLRGRLVATSARAIRKSVKPKYLHMSGFKRRFQLFGEDPKSRQPIPSDKPRGIIVEGQFDVIRLWQLGYRGSVAMYGANMTPQQIDRFKTIFSSAIALTDGDDAGRTAGELLRQQFQDSNFPIEVVHTPEGLDPGNPKFTLDQAKLLLGEPEVDNDW